MFGISFGTISPDLVIPFVLWLALLSFAYFYLAYRLYDTKTRQAMNMISLALGIVMFGSLFVGMSSSFAWGDKSHLPILSIALSMTSMFFAFLGFLKIKQLQPRLSSPQSRRGPQKAKVRKR